MSVRGRELSDLYRFEIDFDTHAAFAFCVIDDNEFAALGSGEVAENGAVLFLRRWR